MSEKTINKIWNDRSLTQTQRKQRISKLIQDVVETFEDEKEKLEFKITPLFLNLRNQKYERKEIEDIVDNIYQCGYRVRGAIEKITKREVPIPYAEAYMDKLFKEVQDEKKKLYDIIRSEV